LCAERRQILYVGLTGGCAAGKSTVSKLLHDQFGIPVIDVDQAGRRAVEESPAVLAALHDAFGDAYFTAAAKLKRKKLGERVFRDEQARATLNRIVHPAMLKIVAAEMKQAAERTPRTPYVVVDAALLFELDLHKKMDVVVTVWAPLSVCQRRAGRRDGLTKTEVAARYQAQWSMAQKIVGADYTLDNSTTRAALRTAVRHLHYQLLDQAQQKRRRG